MPEMNREEIAKLEALYASNPEGRVFTHLAEAYRKAGDYDRARTILEQGLTKHPGYASAYVVLGRVQLDLNQNNDAEASFRRVLELDPHNLVALRSLGEIARADGRHEQALGYFEELRHQDPSNMEIEGVITELRKAAAETAAAQQEAPAEIAAPSGSEDAEHATAAASEASAETPEQAEPEAETPSQAETEVPELPAADFEVVATSFEQITRVESYGDLVTPDIELNWGTQEGEAEEEPLPGDLADFAGLSGSFDVRDESSDLPVEPEPEPEMPALDFPDLDIGGAAGEEDEIAAETSQAEVVTETMAQLYRDQGLYERSAEVYRALLKERPYDTSLQTSLAEVEALAAIIGHDPAPEARPESGELGDEEPEQPPFVLTAPEAARPQPVEESAAEREEEIESPWMAAPAASTTAPNPYTWTEERAEAEAGPPISTYFRELLAWRPASRPAAPAPAGEPEPEPEVANFEASPELQEQPAVLDLTEPPAVPSDALMPWEEPASPSMPAAPIAPPKAPLPPASMQPSDPVEAAFEEWFSAPGEEPPSAPPAAATAGPGPAELPPASGDEEGDDDDDLEMFRSWLQSLKK